MVNDVGIISEIENKIYLQLMTHGPIKIQSKNQCIYCGKSDIELTDEHLVPYFISGNLGHVLLEASCKECAKITSRFEMDVARGLWGDSRNAYNFPSRKKKKRKKYIYLNNKYNPNEKLKIPYDEYPAPMLFYKMHTAGFLMGYNKILDTSSRWTFISITDDKKLKEFERKYPGQLSAKLRFNHDSYARLIIKIGYCQILTSLDPSDFRAICLPHILGEESNHSFILGSKQKIDDPEKEMGYNLKSISFGNDDYLLIIAEVRIVSNNHTPTYHVVVGDVIGKDRVSYAREKLNGTYDVEVSNEGDISKEIHDEYHWMPRVWHPNYNYLEKK